MLVSLLAMFVSRFSVILRLFFARQDHDEGQLDDDDAPPHGDERQPDDDAHWPDASILPWRYSSQPVLENGCPAVA
jgi:hypothetical protein